MVPWYWMLLLAVFALVLAIVIGYLWGRRKGAGAPLADEQKAMMESEAKSLREQLAAERKAHQLAVATAQTLAKEQKKILEWYNSVRESIKEEARNDFEKLAADPDALDARLERLLPGSSRSEDPTPPSRPR